MAEGSAVSKKTASKDAAAAARLAELTLASLAKAGIPADPVNYAVWYAYHSGRRPELTRAIDALLEQGVRFTPARSEELFSAFFSAERQGETFGTVGPKLEATMARILELVGDASGNAERYGERLEDFSGAIEKAGAGSAKPGGEVARLIQGLVEETRSMAERSRSLEARLAESSEELTELRRTLQEVRLEATTDGLTGLANRKQFDLTLKLAAAEAAESRRPLSLMMIDVDHFKRFNDSFGHRIGDQVLRTLAHILKSGVKGADTPARYGGEEFAVILPDTAVEEAARLADRLRLTLAGKRLTNRSTGADYGAITISIGVARLRPGEPLEEVIARADAALYRAKAAGRNCVVDEHGQTYRGTAAGETAHAAG